MKKNIKFIILFLLIFLVCVEVGADIGGNGVAGDYGSSSGGGGSCSDKGEGSYNGTSGIRVTLIRSNGTKLNSKDFYVANSWGNIPSKSIGNNCSKIEYLKGTCSSARVNGIENLSSLPNFMEGSGNTKESIQQVFNYLENNKYANLKSIMTKTGYNCINNVGGSGCSIDVMSDTYIVVEPMTMFGRQFATAYEMDKIGTDCWLKLKWGKLASFMADGKLFGLTNKVSGSNYYEAIKNVNSSNGVMVYSISEVLELPENGSLIVKKTNSSNDVLAQLSSNTEIRFKLYNNSSCTGTALKDFKAGEEVKDLPVGTYYIKEYQTKTGYHLPQQGEAWYCSAVKVDAGAKTEVKITNKTECEYRFNSNMTMQSRIDLYNYIKTTYNHEFNALLDMSNTTAESACKHINVNKNYSTSCLTAASSSTNSSSFTNTNLSMYTEKYGTYTFCLTTYNLSNELGLTNFKDIKSGQAIISTEDVVAKGVLNRVCYNYGDNVNAIPALNYNDYISGDVKLGGVKLIKEEISSRTEYNSTITANYTLPLMYASNKDGKVYYGYCPSGEYCKILGKGIISKFNLNPSDNPHTLNFDITLKKDKFGELKTESECQYTVKNELIVYPNNIDLAFRTVKTDSSSAFLDKSGNGERKPGANWSDEDVRNKVLIENNNSYDKTGEGPKYTILLVPSDIEKIRKYNKKTSYDDYTLYCESDGTICHSRFLAGLKKGVLEYYNTETQKVENTWTLQNKLIAKEEAS